jgi:DNA-binding FrmR family transcriptional regulator
MFSSEMEESVTKRLNRIEGQVKGIQRMIQEDRDCREIMNQLASVRAALYNVSTLLVKNYVMECLHHPEQKESTDEVIKEMIEALLKAPH